MTRGQDAWNEMVARLDRAVLNAGLATDASVVTDHGDGEREEYMGCPIVVDPTIPPDTISVVSGEERVDIKVTPDGTWGEASLRHLVAPDESV